MPGPIPAADLQRVKVRPTYTLSLPDAAENGSKKPPVIDIAQGRKRIPSGIDSWNVDCRVNLNALLQPFRHFPCIGGLYHEVLRYLLLNVDRPGLDQRLPVKGIQGNYVRRKNERRRWSLISAIGNWIGKP